MTTDQQPPAPDTPPETPPPIPEPPPLAEQRPAPAGPSWRRWWTESLRAMLLRPLRELPAQVGPLTMAAVLAMAALLILAADRAAYPQAVDFSPYGWVWSQIHLLFPLALVWWVFSSTRRGLRHASPVAAWVLLSQLALMGPALLMRGLAVLNGHGWTPALARQEWVGWSLWGLCLLWALLIFWRLAQALHQWRAVRLGLPLLALGLLVLQSWTLRTSSWEPRQNAEEGDRPQLSLSQPVFMAQEALLQKTLSGLEERPAADDIRVYGLVYAPYAQDVFQRESEMVAERMTRRLDAKGRVVRLLNHPAATEQWPWATPLNLQRAIQALAARMDRERDVLLIYMTSHGGRDHHLSSSHWPLQVDELTAAQLRQWLDEAGIRYRAIAVSACYSGGWIDPLKGADTLVMTAADAQHTSYGCGNRSELTFFGKAVFEESLNRMLSLEAAFADAVPRIRTREIEAGKDDGFSNPQIAVGEGFRAQWAHWMERRAAAPESTR
ncbi:C13 family peptidase [Hydrogenophaga sp. MI9]|uniref:C13 family peptidase n=1 Tax=Hydrogenophaga sp. MI9 TaxID=3453719 RepID=UPI003EEA94CC